jgi:hypothetical protein
MVILRGFPASNNICTGGCPPLKPPPEIKSRWLGYTQEDLIEHKRFMDIPLCDEPFISDGDSHQNSAFEIVTSEQPFQTIDTEDQTMGEADA